MVLCFVEGAVSYLKHDSATTSARQSRQQFMAQSIDIDKLQAKLKLEETGGLSELDKNPVYEAIARYLGIGLSIEDRAAKNRRGDH